MKVLNVNQKLFMWLGIYPIEDQTNHRKQLLHKLLGWLTVLLSGSVIMSSSKSTINHGATDLSNALYAAFPIVGCLRTFVSFTSMIVFRQKITLLFENLQTFYDQSKLIYL